MASLFERVNVGDAGITVYDPVLLARLADGRVFAEVHPGPYKQGPDPVTYLRALAERTGITEDIDWGRVGAVSRAREAIAVDVTRAPVSITR